MLGFAPLYSRNGQHADGDPQVAELLKRTVDNQYQATCVVDMLVAQMRSGGTTPWTAPIPSMAILHTRWLSAILWQAATAYLDGVVECYASNGVIPPETYSECDSLCDAAAAMTLRAIQLQSEMDHGVRPTNAELVPFLSLATNGPGYAGVWRACEAVFLQVRADIRVIEAFGTPPQMRTVQQVLKAAYQPKADMFAYLQNNWNSTTSRDNRIEVVQTALPIAQELFSIGQQLWAPYLIGQVYAEALRYKPTLAELGITDPWVLTDATQKQARQNDRASKDELTEFWESLADPSVASRLHEQLLNALQTGKIRKTGRSYPTVPWQEQYLVRYPITFGTRDFKCGDLIGFYVSDDGTGKQTVEIRRTGRLTHLLDLLGQRGPSK